VLKCAEAFDQVAEFIEKSDIDVEKALKQSGIQDFSKLLPEPIL